MSGFQTKFVIRTIETSPQIQVFDDPVSDGRGLADDWSETGIITISSPACAS
ncbi:MAG: hypothetical protein R3E76_17060 [Planctomycetota bacterium]